MLLQVLVPFALRNWLFEESFDETTSPNDLLRG